MSPDGRGGNGHAVKVRAYKVRYIDNSEEMVQGDALDAGINVVAVRNGINTAKILSLHNVISIEPTWSEKE